MDTSKIYKVVAELLEEEASLNLQGQVSGVRNSLSSLQQNPADQNIQLTLRKQIDNLYGCMLGSKYENDPIFASYVDQIGGADFFSKSLAEFVLSRIENNVMTPAVAFQEITQLSEKRRIYVESLNSFEKSANELGLGEEHIIPGESQIGFRIPRNMFDNEFKSWIAELREITLIVRTFSELKTGSVEPIKLGEVSSTDPIVFLIQSAPTIGALAAAVSWSLNQWKKVEEIRKLRAETAKLASENNGNFQKLVDDFDKAIQDTIGKAIEKYTEELVSSVKNASRAKELRNAVNFALISLVARVERGMSVEIRFLPPSDGLSKEEEAAYSDISAAIPTLKFPPPSPSPVLNLPEPSAKDDSEGKSV